MAKDFESLKALVNETKVTVTSAASVIRGLIHDRNVALGAAKPADVAAHAKTQQVAVEAGDLQDGLDVARKDLDAAIEEAAAAPKPIAPTPVAPKPIAAPTPVAPTEPKPAVVPAPPSVTGTPS